MRRRKHFLFFIALVSLISLIDAVLLLTDRKDVYSPVKEVILNLGGIAVVIMLVLYLNNKNNNPG